MVLHICNDYFGSKVHKNLYQSLDKLNISQTIYCPIRKKTKIELASNTYSNSKIVLSKPMRNWHRILFKKKIKFLYKDLLDNIDINEIKLTHATNLFSDGAIAYRLFKDKQIPYIIAVRSTDIEVFLNFRPDLIQLAWNIMGNADKIVFISEALKTNFTNHYKIAKRSSLLKDKYLIQFNGIDDFWLDNIQPQKNLEPIEILYVGRLLKRKNVVNIANAVLKLNSDGIKCKFNIVGEGGSDEKKIKELAKNNPPQINYIGAINKKEKLKFIYNQNQIFAMPSKGETFGLVYIEALSQGLPILFSKNDGIYGVFDLKIGEFCNPNKPNEIVNALIKIITNYNSYEINKVDFEQFRWKNIANNYKYIYSKLTT